MKYIIKVHGIKSGYRGYVTTRLCALKHKQFEPIIKTILYLNDSVVNHNIIFAKKFKSLKSVKKRVKYLEKLHKGYIEFEILRVEE